MKNKLRREKIAAREALSAGERQAKSEEIARHIAALPEFQAARTVMLYAKTYDLLGRKTIMPYV